MPFISHISVIVFDSKSIITGVVLNSEPKKTKMTGILRTLKSVLFSYSIPLLKNKPITIKINDFEYKIITDKNAVFNLEFNYVIENEPKIMAFFQGREIKITQDYPIFFKNFKNQIGIISDIDDTIIVSHTASVFKRIGVLGFVPPQKRKAIYFSQKLLSLKNLIETNVYYVSKSESNLFNLLSTFIRIHNLPQAPLFLTPHLSFRKLINQKKGKDFKLKRIQLIIENTQNKKFILLGDDTQKDMEVYQIIAEKYKERIIRIYIRQTRDNVNSKKKELWNKLKFTYPNSVYFNENTDIKKEFDILNKLAPIKE